MISKLITLTSPNLTSKVIIDKGELISYQKNEEEFIHQKNDLGWNNSDTEMFPIIGPTQKNKFIVSTPNGDCIQDQHGILRTFDYTLTENNKSLAIYQKKYFKNTRINNPKYPDKSTEKEMFWPYDFTFTKKYQLDNEALKITFEFQSEKGMPFMFGYHPAFKIFKKSNAYCTVNQQKTTIDEVLKGGSVAYPLLNQNKITLNNGKHEIEITTKGFNHFMLWTEVDTMICIEPITQYPNFKTPLNSQKYSEKNMKLANGNEGFIVEIKPKV